jgi:hypothetical protein
MISGIIFTASAIGGAMLSAIGMRMGHDPDWPRRGSTGVWWDPALAAVLMVTTVAMARAAGGRRSVALLTAAIASAAWLAPLGWGLLQAAADSGAAGTGPLAWVAGFGAAVVFVWTTMRAPFLGTDSGSLRPAALETDDRATMPGPLDSIVAGAVWGSGLVVFLGANHRLDEGLAAGAAGVPAAIVLVEFGAATWLLSEAAFVVCLWHRAPLCDELRDALAWVRDVTKVAHPEPVFVAGGFGGRTPLCEVRWRGPFRPRLVVSAAVVDGLEARTLRALLVRQVAFVELHALRARVAAGTLALGVVGVAAALPDETTATVAAGVLFSVTTNAWWNRRCASSADAWACRFVAADDLRNALATLSRAERRANRLRWDLGMWTTFTEPRAGWPAAATSGVHLDAARR